MSFLLIIAAAVLLLTSVFFFYPRKAEKRSQEVAGAVSCKKCGIRIAVSNPSKLHHEFSVSALLARPVNFTSWWTLRGKSSTAAYGCLWSAQVAMRPLHKSYF
jgi:hypothetical protein